MAPREKRDESADTQDFLNMLSVLEKHGVVSTALRRRFERETGDVTSTPRW